jgi:hypothetical protein
MVSRAAALGLRAALDTTGSGRPGRPTETGRAKRQSGHRTQYRGAAPDPGARGRSGQMPARDPAFRDTFSGRGYALVQVAPAISAGIGCADGASGRLMYEVASSSGLDRPRTNRSGCASYAASRVALRSLVFSSTLP